MVEPWLIYFLFFATAFLLVQFIYGFVTNDLGTRRRVDQRFASVDSSNSRNANRDIEVKKRKDLAGASPSGLLGGFQLLLLQSGLKVSLLQLALFFAAAWIGLSFAVPRLPVPFLGLVLSGAGAALMITGFLHFKRSRRIARFAEQLPDVIDIIVRSLRAGHPLPVSLSLVAREMPEPAGTEFTLTCDEITYGREVREALENLYRRIGYEDLSLLVTSISVSHQTGGNLGEILGRLSKMLRERFRMRRKVKSLSSEGRFSALALSVFPFVMFGILNVISPQYYGDVWGHPFLNIAAGISAILLVTGNIIMYKMVNFKF
jgi:tight adherence protein B